MATVTEMRARLREAGEDVPVRGKLSDEWVSRYDELGLDASTPDPDPWPDDDDLDPVAGGEPIPEEVRPSRQRARKVSSPARSSGGLIGRLLERTDPKAKSSSKSKKAPPRVSLEKLVTRAYTGVSRILTPVSPAASRCLAVQAPMAGVMLNDIVANTVVDRMLQPVARAEDKLDVVFALMVPPVACVGLEMTAGMERTPEVMLRQTFLMQMLREGLRTGLEVTERYATEIKAAVERQARYDQQVDELISMILVMPQGEMVPDDVRDAEMAGAAA